MDKLQQSKWKNIFPCGSWKSLLTLTKIRQVTGGCLAFVLYLTSSASKDAPATLTSTVLRTLPPSTPPRVLLSSHARILRHLCMDQAMPPSRIPFYTIPYNGSTYLLRPNPKDASARRMSAITPVKIMTFPSPPLSHSVLCHSIHVTLSSMRIAHGRARSGAKFLTPSGLEFEMQPCSLGAVWYWAND